jgi:hypothetical protein
MNTIHEAAIPDSYRAAPGTTLRKKHSRSNTQQHGASAETSVSQKIKSETCIVAPATARWMRDNCHFDRQRKISHSNVGRLAAEMGAGRFIPGTQVYICTLPDGSNLIINGNHTLEAISECGISQTMTITEMKVSDIDEAGRIYAVFDIHKTRTWMDSLRGCGLEDTVDMAPKVLAAITAIDNNFEQNSFTHSNGNSRIERFKRLEEYKEAADLLSAAISGCPSHTTKLIKRAVVMAVALETLKHQPSTATEFWRSFAKDDGLVSGSPEKALIGWLRNANVTGQAARKEMAIATALAWNAYFKGVPLVVCKPKQAGKFTLLGTPWSRGIASDE